MYSISINIKVAFLYYSFMLSSFFQELIELNINMLFRSATEFSSKYFFVWFKDWRAVEARLWSFYKL